MSTADLVGTHILAALVGIAVGVLVVLAVLSHRRAPIKKLRQRHFGTATLDSLVITGRKFHARVRADLQRAIDQFFVSGTTVTLR
jgi:hypothetical protein